MGRTFLHEPESSYYPPRARWYSFIFTLGDLLRHGLARDHKCLPYGVKISEMLAGFFVPGLAVWLRRPRVFGGVALGGSALLALIFIVGLGYPAANLAFGLLISLHVTGFVYYCQPLLNDEPFSHRLRFTVLVMVGMGLLLYIPARTFILGHWVTPLRVHGHVMVVQINAQPKNIHRGDWVAYRLPDQEEGPHGDVVVVHQGIGLGPVLAVAGDEVRFNANSFSVNGVAHANLWRMPLFGQLIVPENCWFIWPDLGISGYGNVQQSSIDRAILEMASVDQSHFYGRPFHHWFLRKQY